jgi:hypothetical protein
MKFYVACHVSLDVKQSRKIFISVELSLALVVKARVIKEDGILKVQI